MGRKMVVLGIICLFIIAGVVPSISGDIDQRSDEDDIPELNIRVK